VTSLLDTFIKENGGVSFVYLSCW